jgi:hypothetical protein
VNISDNLSGDVLARFVAEQEARQARLLAALPEVPAELLNELAEQSARAAELLLAEQAKRLE